MNMTKSVVSMIWVREMMETEETKAQKKGRGYSDRLVRLAGSSGLGGTTRQPGYT